MLDKTKDHYIRTMNNPEGDLDKLDSIEPPFSHINVFYTEYERFPRKPLEVDFSVEESPKANFFKLRHERRTKRDFRN